MAQVAIMLMLSGCMGDQCIDADDFGFPRVTVSARYDSSEIVGTGENEVAPWRDNQLTVNGQPLTIVVKNWSNITDINDAGNVSAWSPWYGTSSDGGTKSAYLNTINKRFIECTWNGNASGGYGLYSNPATRYAMITNAPCLLHKGVGLYALIAKPGTNPNTNLSADPPQGVTFHVGNPGWQADTTQTEGAYQLFDVNTRGEVYPAGGLVYKYTGNDSSNNPVNVHTYANQKLYFKILDRVHGDNSGQYRVIIKSGINDPYPDPFQYITALVKAQFFGDPNDTSNSTGVVKNIYLQVINNQGYKTFVGAVLILYIMFTSFSFLVGVLEITQTELITRVIKAGVVAALLDPHYGWTFFYNYLFVFFIDGTSELISIIQQAANTGGGSSSLLTMLIAPETIAKVLSLLFTSPTGIIYIVVYLVLLVFYVFISFKAAALYISALIMIGMIIIMGPIFLTFMLFDFTKSLYENWIKQLMYYTLQPIILLASIAFMSIMIRHEVYATLGFRVCRWDFPDLGPLFSLVNPSDSSGSGTPKSLFFWFFPSPMIGTDFSDTMAVIPVPEAHIQLDANGNSTGRLCNAYECNENRYVDLPFLDPNNPRDMERRNNFRTGTFVQFENLIYIAILLYLMHKFNETAVAIPRALNNTSANSAAPEHAAEAATQGIIAPVQNKVETAVHKATAPVRKAAREIAFKVENATLGRASRAYDNWRTNSVADDALSKGAQQSVLDSVRQNHGLDRKDIKLTAKTDYENAIAKKLVEASIKEGSAGGISYEQAIQAVRETLAVDDKGVAVNRHGYSIDNEGKAVNKDGHEEGWRRYYEGDKNLKELFAEVNKTGKTFEQFMDERPEGGKSLKELATEARKTQKFQEAYVHEFESMSKKGYGFLGKKSAAFRNYKDYQASLDEHGKGLFHKDDSFFGDARQAERGDSLHSGYDSLKYALSGGLLEGDTMQYNYDNRRMQTYQEEIADRYKRDAQKDLKKRINAEITINGKDILRPENLARMKKLSPAIAANYERMAQEQIVHDVHQSLTYYSESGADPALMGERYMKEKMTDTQFRKAIDRAVELEEEHVREDRYLKDQNYKGKNDDVSKIMQERENAIRAEFKRNIAVMNEYRQKAGMPVYNPALKAKP